MINSVPRLSKNTIPGWVGWVVGWLDYSSLIPTQPSWGWGLAELGNDKQKIVKGKTKNEKRKMKNDKRQTKKEK